MPKTVPSILTTRVAMSNKVGTLSSTLVLTHPEASAKFTSVGPAPEFRVVTQQIWVSEPETLSAPTKASRLLGYRSLADLANFSTKDYLLQKQEDRKKENRRCLEA